MQSVSEAGVTLTVFNLLGVIWLKALGFLQDKKPVLRRYGKMVKDSLQAR